MNVAPSHLTTDPAALARWAGEEAHAYRMSYIPDFLNPEATRHVLTFLPRDAMKLIRYTWGQWPAAGITNAERAASILSFQLALKAWEDAERLVHELPSLMFEMRCSRADPAESLEAEPHICIASSWLRDTPADRAVAEAMLKWVHVRTGATWSTVTASALAYGDPHMREAVMLGGLPRCDQLAEAA